MGKLLFLCTPTVPWEDILSNKEACRRAGYRRIEERDRRDGRLAVVGGGPSITRYIDEIRKASEVWAINGACQMLQEHGIESTLYAMDPDPIVVKWCNGAKRALLCDRVCPEAFAALEGAEIRVFELANDVADGVNTGSSTATAAFSLGLRLGWYEIDFYGCESSFEDETHAYQDEKREHLLWVDVGGKRYKTAPDFYVQAQEMARVIKVAPNNYRAHGGGLLQALIDHDDHDVALVSRALMETIQPLPEAA